MLRCPSNLAKHDVVEEPKKGKAKEASDKETASGRHISLSGKQTAVDHMLLNKVLKNYKLANVEKTTINPCTLAAGSARRI